MRHCLALDLKYDPALIAQYEAHHRSVWPEVRAHLHAHGVMAMDIYRLGTRMVMVMETDDACYDPEAMALAARDDPKIREWEALMWQFQAPTPWTQQGEKWTEMAQVFCLDENA